MIGQDIVTSRCPVCGGSLEAVRSQRLISVAGRWRDQGPEHWQVRCPNAHIGDGETLPAAVEDLSKRNR